MASSAAICAMAFLAARTAAAEGAEGSFPGQYAPPAAPGFPGAPKRCLERPANLRCACLDWLADDWASLRRHATANARLAQARPGERRVVFFGDSITDNWSRPAYGGFFPGKPYINRGIGSQTTSQLLLRFQRDVAALHPKAVVILAGTNDISGNTGPTPPSVTARNIATMTELAHLAGIRVVLATLLPVRDGLPGADGKPVARTAERPLARIAALNRWLALFARRNDLGLVDYHAAMVDETGQLRAGLTDDGVHPNAAGYAVIAPLAEQAIAASLRRPPPPPRPADVPATGSEEAPPPVDAALPITPAACRQLGTGQPRCDCLADVLRSWPRLDRYAAANATLLKDESPAERRVVLFGGALAAGWPGASYVTRGIAGQTTEQLLVRFRQDVLDLHPAVALLDPGLGDLQAGTGKRLLADVEENLEAMTALARLHHIAVVLASVPPVSDAKLRADGTPAIHSGDVPPGHVLALDAWLADHARRHHLVFLDTHAVLSDASGQLRADLTGDGLTLSPAGYAALAPSAERAIATALAGPGPGRR
jgi:lysophospholipase L1-like esterase